MPAVLSPFCISEKLSDIHIEMLSLVPATYPFVLLIIIFILMELHAMNFKIVQKLWKLFTTVLDKMNIKPVTGEAVIHGFASSVFLSNAAVYATMGSIITETGIYRKDSTLYQKSFFYDPTLQWLGYKHIQYFLIVLIPFMFLTVIPSVFHIIYPTRIYKYLSRCVSARKRLAITAFAEALQVCFKDGLNGTRDYRSLAGIITLIPIIFGLSRNYVLERVGIGSRLSDSINYIVTCCIITYIQPCKSSIANISLSVNLLLLGGIYAIEHWWFYYWSIPTETQIMTMIIIPLLSHILVFVWAGYTLTSHVMRRCRHCFNQRDYREALVNAVNKCLHRSRRGGYQEMN